MRQQQHDVVPAMKVSITSEIKVWVRSPDEEANKLTSVLKAKHLWDRDWLRDVTIPWLLQKYVLKGISLLPL